MKHFVLAALLATAPVVASAATITPVPVDFTQTTVANGKLTASSPLSFVFDVTTPATFDIALTSNGSYEDLKAVSYTYAYEGFSSEVLSFDVYGKPKKASSGVGFLPTFTAPVGTVTLAFFGPVKGEVTVGIAADATPAAVPLPAGAALLGTGLAAFGALRAKRRKAA